MKNQGRRLLVGSLATVLVTAGLGFAGGGSMHKSSSRKADITFASTAKLPNGATLPAGTYRLEVPENTQTPTATFSRDNKVVATAPVSLTNEENKNPTTEVLSVADGNAQKITDIRPAGWKEDLHFSTAGQ